MVLWLVSVIGLAMGDNYWLMVIFRFTQGIGKAAFLSIAPVIIDLVAEPDKRSLMLALFFASEILGFSIGHMIGGIIIDNVWFSFPSIESWRVSYLLQIVIGLVNVLLCFSMKGPENILRIKDGNIQDSDTFWEKVQYIMRNKVWVFCTLSMSVENFLNTGFSFYLIQYVRDIYGVTPTDSGILIGGIVLVTVIFGSIAGGIILDRALKMEQQTQIDMQMCESSTRIAMYVVTISSAISIVVAFIEQLSLFCVILSFVLFTFLMSTGPINSSALWCLELKDRALGRSLTTVSYFLLGKSFSPVILGAMKEPLGWKWLIFFLSTQMITVAFFLFLAYRSAKKEVKKIRIMKLATEVL